MTDNNNIFGEKVKFLRKHRHWTQENLADRAGLSQSEVSRIEKGRFRDLNEETVRSLARAFEIAPETLAQNTPFATLFGQSETLVCGPVYEGLPFTAYFASALTGLDDERLTEVESLDEKVDQICRAYQHYPIFLYRPRLYTSPKFNPETSARAVYDIDQERVSTADLLILAAVFPSLGAGMELQLALQSCSSVVLLTKKGNPLSRMVQGCPAEKVIVEYDDLREVEEGLSEALRSLMPRLAELRLSHIDPQGETAGFELGDRIRRLRRDRGNMKAGELARMIGVDEAYIQTLETKHEQISNPSLKILRRIARALSTSEAYVISGQQVPIQQKDQRFNDHLRALDALVEETSMSAKDYKELWSEHVEKYQYALSLPGADNRVEIGGRQYWVERYDQLKKKISKGGKLF
ncbi:MAG: helix-turn-helix transcriptional regulator [Acidobacteria bacterium]|nr:helix-turn-helix transcriptional regulator [Acidobacteriota bacterium]